MRNRRWLAALAALGAAALYGSLRRGWLARAAANVRAFDLPSAGLYDALPGALLAGFYRRVGDELAAAGLAGRLLEVGTGPGRLAVGLAERTPGLLVAGVDLAPEMVERATWRAARAGLADRVRFVVGDAGALPFASAAFDGVVSTLSLHHWAEPERGLAEVRRVLKPGGRAWIYDLAGWALRGMRHGDGVVERLAAANPGGQVSVARVRWPGPVAAIARLELRRESADG